MGGRVTTDDAVRALLKLESFNHRLSIASQFIGHDTPGDLLLIEDIENRFHAIKELGIPGWVSLIVAHHVFDQAVEEGFVGVTHDVKGWKFKDGPFFERFD